MSYSHYELTDLELSSTEVRIDGHLEVAATVTNTGDRAGAEVVQLYLADRVAQVARPMKQLIGYAKVRLEPGEAKRIIFEVHMDRASFVGRDHERIVEPGEMRVMVGSSSEDLPLQGSFPAHRRPAARIRGPQPDHTGSHRRRSRAGPEPLDVLTCVDHSP